MCFNKFSATLQGYVTGLQDTSTVLQTWVHPEYLYLEWTPIENISRNSSVPNNFLTYQIMGTTSHSVIQLKRETTHANVSTSSYPGMLFFIRLFGNGKHLATRFVRSACGTTHRMTNNMASFITSPNYPEKSRSMTVCRWTYKGDADKWFKLTQNDVVLPHDSCQTFINISGQPLLCKTSSTEDVFYVTSNVTTVEFVSRSQGGHFNFTIEAIPSLELPTNITARNIDDVVRVSWIDVNPIVRNLYYMVIYNVIPSLIETIQQMASNTSHYDIDVKGHKGQLFNISLALKMPYWKSNRTSAVIMRSGCHEEFYLQERQSIILTTPNFPQDTESNILCTWDGSTSPNAFLSISMIDTDVSYDLNIPRKIISVTSPNETITHLLVPNKPLVMEGHYVTVQLRTDGLRYSGFRLMVRSVAPPTLPPQHVQVQLTGPSMLLTWRSPSLRGSDVIKYVILYDVMPDVKGQELNVNKSTNQYTLSTRAYKGRLFSIGIQAVTEGGRSHISRPIYVRTHCGGMRSLKHHDTMLIISPGNKQDEYPPDVVCKWAISTNELLWLKVDVEKFELENSLSCVSDFLEINGRRYCGSNIQSTLLYKTNYIEMVFVTNEQIQDSGFILTAKAVAPAPDPPEQIWTTSSEYGLIVRWTMPNQNHAYVIGYRVNFRYKNFSRVEGILTSGESMLTNENSWHSVVINKDTFIYVINTLASPGAVIEIWMESLGEASNSASTDVITSRTHCGGTIKFKNRTEYISSPKFPDMDNNDIYCLYHVIGEVEVNLTIIDVKFQNDDPTKHCSYGYLLVDGMEFGCGQHTSDVTTFFYGYEFIIKYHSNDGRSRFLLELKLSKRIEKVVDDSLTNNYSYITLPNIILLIPSVFLSRVFF
ncbi:uncharacterized protein LOC132563137 [Ylistrum balloti]|uniref:uncharacterized protein LOC132563137 n=1 Tax=Ylistrum balloti TaxID=509963 RepID=UPI002905EC2D|nr:uncharacterized protein LOC132563137 [Ylistrum balloti]